MNGIIIIPLYTPLNTQVFCLPSVVLHVTRVSWLVFLLREFLSNLFNTINHRSQWNNIESRLWQSLFH